MKILQKIPTDYGYVLILGEWGFYILLVLFIGLIFAMFYMLFKGDKDVEENID